MPVLGPMGASRRRGRRRGLVVGAAVGSAAAKRGNNEEPAVGTSSENQVAELEKLAELKDKGILTEEEFQAKKKQILGL